MKNTTDPRQSRMGKGNARTAHAVWRKNTTNPSSPFSKIKQTKNTRSVDAKQLQYYFKLGRFRVQTMAKLETAGIQCAIRVPSTYSYLLVRLYENRRRHPVVQQLMHSPQAVPLRFEFVDELKML